MQPDLNRRPVGPQSNTLTTRPQWPPDQIYPGSSKGGGGIVRANSPAMCRPSPARGFSPRLVRAFTMGPCSSLTCGTWPRKRGPPAGSIPPANIPLSIPISPRSIPPGQYPQNNTANQYPGGYCQGGDIDRRILTGGYWRGDIVRGDIDLGDIDWGVLIWGDIVRGDIDLGGYRLGVLIWGDIVRGILIWGDIDWGIMTGGILTGDIDWGILAVGYWLGGYWSGGILIWGDIARGDIDLGDIAGGILSCYLPGLHCGRHGRVTGTYLQDDQEKKRKRIFPLYQYSNNWLDRDFC